MISIDGIPGRTAWVDGKELLFFSGFAYLGMPSLPAFQVLLTEGVRKAGAVFPSSRISNTPSSLYAHFEDKLSAFTGLPRSASFSSGYLASQAATAFAATTSTLLYAPGTHPSLQTGKHDGLPAKAEWPASAISLVNGAADLSYTLIMESVNPLTGQLQDFSWLREITRPVRLLIDDSHGIGILGNRGQGIIAYLPRDNHFRYLISYSLSKAFSCEGGAVSGDAADIEGIRRLPWFTASTPMSPAFTYAWMNGGPLFEGQLEQLRDNIRDFREKNAAIPSITHDPRLPVVRVPWEGFCDYCLRQGILLSSFRYPSPADPQLARIVLNALHTPGDLGVLAGCLKAYAAPTGT